MHVNNIYSQFSCSQLQIYSQLTLPHTQITFTHTLEIPTSQHCKPYRRTFFSQLSVRGHSAALRAVRTLSACHLLRCFLSIPFRMHRRQHCSFFSSYIAQGRVWCHYILAGDSMANSDCRDLCRELTTGTTCTANLTALHFCMYYIQ